MLDNAASRRASIVDHDIDAAERLVRLRDKFLGLGILPQVCGDGDDLATSFFRNFLRHSLERPGAARADRNVRAFFGERERDALADAFRAAGHCRGFALESEIHRAIPFGWREILAGLWPL